MLPEVYSIRISPHNEYFDADSDADADADADAVMTTLSLMLMLGMRTVVDVLCQRIEL